MLLKHEDTVYINVMYCNRKFIQNPFKISTQRRSLHWPVLYNVKCRYKRIIMRVCKTKHSELKKSPVVGPRTRVEPANGSRRQLTDYVDVQIYLKRSPHECYVTTLLDWIYRVSRGTVYGLPARCSMTHVSAPKAFKICFVMSNNTDIYT